MINFLVLFNRCIFALNLKTNFMVIPKPISEEEWEDYIKNNNSYNRSGIPINPGYVTIASCKHYPSYHSPYGDESYIESVPFRTFEDAKLTLFLHHLIEVCKLLNFEALKPSVPEQVVEIKVPGELLIYLAEQSPEIADKIHELLLQHGKEVKTQEKRLEDTISFLNRTKTLTKTIISAVEIENEFLTNEVTSLTSKLQSLETDKAELTKRLRLMESVVDSNAKDKNFTFAFMNYLLDENQRLQELLDLKIMST